MVVRPWDLNIDIRDYFGDSPVGGPEDPGGGRDAFSRKHSP